MTVLIYRGGGEYIPGIPAHDLDAEWIEAIAGAFGLSTDETIVQLTSRGLYTRVEHLDQTDNEQGEISDGLRTEGVPQDTD